MNSVSRFSTACRTGMLVVIFPIMLFLSATARADTIVSIEFDTTSDLTELFNPDSEPQIFNAVSGGLLNSGVVNSSGDNDTDDIWTTKNGYSVTGIGDRYRLSAFFRMTGSSGHGGLGLATSNTNEHSGAGYTTSGIGYIATDKEITIVSTVTTNPTPATWSLRLDAFQTLFEGSWYLFELDITAVTANTFDVTITINNANDAGQIGSEVVSYTETGIANNDVSQASSLHPYISTNALTGSRFDRIDRLMMRLSGGPQIVPDPNSDTDNDGTPDITDDDDDGDGTPDSEDDFPLNSDETKDNDNDGIGDNADTDDDNDGIPDTEDLTPNGDTDSDNDGVPDDLDDFPNDPTETTDNDDDGIGDNADLDDDNDGTPDDEDAFPNDENESVDTDNDGVGNNEDEDDDGDGIEDAQDTSPLGPEGPTDTDRDGVNDDEDAFPNDPTETTDTDNDGVGDNADAFPDDPSETLDTDNDSIGNNADSDDDNDGYADPQDSFPLDPTEWADTDNDGIGNNADNDDDGDSIPDSEDNTPLGEAENNDSDNDGVPNAQDAFPFDPTESLDSDGDGIGNNADIDDDNDTVIDTVDEFPLNPLESVDTDQDGIGNNSDIDDDGDSITDEFDAFPLDPTETLDTDNDGVGNNADAFPLDPSETTDTDNDGVGDNADAFPGDPTEWLDTDNDGIGNNADTDDDNDGAEDQVDAFPLDPNEQLDSDNDGIGDNADTDDNSNGENNNPVTPTPVDSDNDGVIDSEDAFPNDPTESRDSDLDGVGDNADVFPNNPMEVRDADGDSIGDNADNDDDNDGVFDVLDLFPLDPQESADNDNDGSGDNADNDDDNDGTPDEDDAFPLDAAESVDSDGDGIGNNADTDDDNDGYNDALEAAMGSDALSAESVPEGLDMDRDTLPDHIERGSDADGDGISNEFDVDSDNDGIFDLIEANQNPAEAAALDADNDGMMDTLALSGLPRVSVPMDTDGDGIRDYRDLDSDNDGLTDRLETTRRAPVTNPLLVSQPEFFNDESTNPALADPDGDGLVNYRDLDSDNDGIPDLVEAGGQDNNNDGMTDAFLDLNADGLDDAYALAPLTAIDTDSDGDPDYIDLDSNNDGAFDILDIELENTDLDGDGRFDIATDSDGDGIFDYADASFTGGADTDGDGIDDRFDATVLGDSDSDNDGIADRYDADQQGDGFIQVAFIQAPEQPTEPPVDQPEPANPVDPEVPDPLVSTSINGGGCSIQGIPGAEGTDLTLMTLLIFASLYILLLRIGTLRFIKGILSTILAISLTGTQVLANIQSGLYLGLGAGVSDLQPEVENATVEERESQGSSWIAQAGYQFNRNWGAEIEYANLGTTTINPLGSVDYQDINISGLYHIGGMATAANGKRFSVFGRLGLGSVSNDSTLNIRRENSTHWLAGAGVEVPLTKNLSLRAEGINYDTDARRIGLSLTYRTSKTPLPTLAALANRFGWRVGSSDGSGTPNAGAQSQYAGQSIRFYDSEIPFYLRADNGRPWRSPTHLSLEEMMNLESGGATSQYAVNTHSQNYQSDRRHSDSKLLNQADSRRVVISGNSSSPRLAAAMPASSVVGGYQPVLFGFDQNRVGTQYHAQLRSLARYMQNNPRTRVTLTGHTDNVGNDTYNQILSLKRAEAVREFLLQLGIDRKMIRVIGMGEKRPARSNDKPSGRKANRRVTIDIE